MSTSSQALVNSVPYDPLIQHNLLSPECPLVKHLIRIDIEEQMVMATSNLSIISRSMIISRQINFRDTAIIPQQLLILLRPVCRIFSSQTILKMRERSTHLFHPMGNPSVCEAHVTRQ